jgi:hypothetical protein
MMPAARSLLAELEAAAAAAKDAESQFSRRMAQEFARLERERAFAYRRLNLMRAVTDAAACADTEDSAVANGLAVMRSQLGWESDSETRAETLLRFAPVIRAAHAGLDPSEADSPASKIAQALADFEAWYAGRYERSFWSLFEQEITEMPLVER